MVIVGTDAVVVERVLLAGLLGCSGCGGVLRPWGYARVRVLRLFGREERRRPRRGRCAKCLVTHVLLAEDGLVRRRDGVEVIGSALLARAGGRGHRGIARMVGCHPSTVRGWLRRFAGRVEEVRVFFTRWAHALDPGLGAIVPAGARFADAVEAIAVAARAAVGRFGSRSPWSFAAGVTRGGLLATRVDPWSAP